MACEVLIRRARDKDEAARAELLRESLSSQFFDTFIYFFFQEVTLQAVVLSGAVLFIFCGASVTACCMLVPAAAVLVALGVSFALAAHAEALRRDVRLETWGWVAEVRGPLGVAPPPLPSISYEPDSGAPAPTAGQHVRLVGTISVWEGAGLGGATAVRALGVARDWRRRGVARALLQAARRTCIDSGCHGLEARVSALHNAARSLLHTQGWELRGSYQRPVVGGAMSLLVAVLGMDLPAA